VVVFAVGGVEPGLGASCETSRPHRAVAARRGGDDEFLDEGPVPLEDLDAVVAPVADIEEPSRANRTQWTGLPKDFTLASPGGRPSAPQWRL